MWEILGDDAADPLPLQLPRTVQFYREEDPIASPIHAQLDFSKDTGREKDRTFVHPGEELDEVVRPAVVKVLLPGFAIFAAQYNQLSLLTSHGAKVRDLHDHRPEETQGARNQTGAKNIVTPENPLKVRIYDADVDICGGRKLRSPSIR